jgi:Ca-activated chloride channel homolog
VAGRINLLSRGIGSAQRASLALFLAIFVVCVFPWSAAVFDVGSLPSAGVVSAQSQSQPPVLRVQVDLQPVDVQVKDAHGNDVLGLSAQDFTVLENGKPQSIAFFDSGTSPVSLVVLVDSASSMSSGGHVGSAEAIASRFLRAGRPGDDISAMDFSDQMGPFQRLTQEQIRNPGAFTLEPARSSGSALYDAIATALCQLRASKNPRQAVVVITNGVDQYSRISLEDLVGLVRSSAAQLFMIGMRSRPEFNFERHAEPKITLITGRDIDNPVVVFDRLLKESGAESFIPDSQRGLDQALDAVSSILQSQYTLAYYPPKNSKTLRKIEVKVDRPGVHVFARRFVAPEQPVSESVHFDPATCHVSPEFHRLPFESRLTTGPNGMTYREDFTDPHSGWPNHRFSRYISGGYELSNPKAWAKNASQLLASSALPDTDSLILTFQQNVIAAYGPWWNDLRASVNVNAVLQPLSRQGAKNSPRKQYPAAGLLFRMNPGGYYALLVSDHVVKKKWSAELVRRELRGESYSETDLIPWTTLPEDLSSDIELSVEAVGSRISIFVSGREIGSVHDDSYYQGLVGIVISGPGHATFKNLLVEQR